MLTSGKTYFIINKMANTVIDLSAVDQKSVTGYPLLKGDNQKWKVVEDQRAHGWTLQNVYDGRYLDIADEPKDGVKVIGVETHHPRLWDIKPDQKDSSAWRIFVQKSNENVDLSDHGNAAPGTPVTLWGQWEGENQVWKFQEV